jgi:hypothetical protein
MVLVSRPGMNGHAVLIFGTSWQEEVARILLFDPLTGEIVMNFDEFSRDYYVRMTISLH